MSDDEVVMLFLLVTGLVLWVVRLKWINRKLKKQLDAQAASPVSLAERPAHAKTSEIDALKARLQVLERIAVDKEHSLVREIDGLRDR